MQTTDRSGAAAGGAAVVLVGGRSRRMGTDKAGLPWAGTTLLGHVLQILADAVAGPLIVVGAAHRPPPALPTGTPSADHLAGRVRFVADPVAGRGPLQGLATGLQAAAADGADRAFVASVDLPRLHPAYVRAVLAALVAPVEVALPVLHGHRQPLAAAYATTLGARALAMLRDGARRPGELFAAAAVRELDATALLADPALAAADPDLVSVHDVDTPDDLRTLTASHRPASHHPAPDRTTPHRPPEPT